VGGQTYIFKSILGTAPNEVLIGGNLEHSLNNLANAINYRGTPGVDYTAATVANTSVEAWTFAYSSWNLGVRALLAGASGNSISVLYTPSVTTYLTWGWEGFGWGTPPITALLGGSDAALVNVATAQDAAFLTNPIEVVIQSPETTDPTLAQTLADAYLASKLVIPNTIKYETYALGLRPGQTQTVTVAARDLDGEYLITEVNHRNTKGNLVLHSVTAIDNLSVPATARWRDIYKQWSRDALGSGGGGVSGGGSVIGGTVTNVTQVGPVVISMGGSRYHAVELL
jgi:hypothetical protein